MIFARADSEESYEPTDINPHKDFEVIYTIQLKLKDRGEIALACLLQDHIEDKGRGISKKNPQTGGAQLLELLSAAFNAGLEMEAKDSSTK